MTRLFSLPLIAIGFAAPANATLPPCVYDDLMREATMVVQITDHSVRTLNNNVCEVQGTIIAVHRGSVDVGRTLTARFNCETGDTQPVIGGAIYSRPEGIAASAAVELHLTADGYIAAEGAGLIGLRAPTQSIAWEPYCD